MARFEFLDDFFLPAPMTGKPLQRLGVTAQFLSTDGHHTEARRAAMAAMLDVYALAPGEWDTWMGTKDSRPRHIRDGFLRDVLESVAQEIEDPDRMMALVLLQREVPPRWQAEVTMQEDAPRRNWLSHLAFSVPPSFVMHDADDYIGTVLRLASLLQPQYGTAGFALVDEIGMAHHRRGAAWPFWQQYPGLDCAVFNFQPKPGRYERVNWLTILGDQVIATLGGSDSVRGLLRDAAGERDLEPPTIMSYDGGILIRAGALPQLGDRAQGNIPASYRAVNAALRSARFEDYPDGPNIHLIDAPRHLDLRRATLDWICRFDDVDSG